MDILESVKKWIAQLTQVVLVLVPLAIVLQILFGGSTEFFGSVVTNLIDLIKQFASQGLVGLIALAIVLWIFRSVNEGGSSSQSY